MSRMKLDPSRSVMAELDERRSHLAKVGLLGAVQSLVQDVWRTNQDRHDEAALGDTARSRGVTASENLRERAMRPISEGGLAADGVGWVVSVRRQTLRLETDFGALLTMKVPCADDRRVPEWAHVSWETSVVRREMAQRNTHLLSMVAGAPGQGLLDAVQMSPTGSVSGIDAMIAWSGSPTSTLTSAHLIAPVLGAEPVIAVVPLWYDEASSSTGEVAPTHNSGQRYDQIVGVEPSLRLKPRPDDVEGNA